jgi:3-dehydroquinate dehydratase I
MSRFCLPIIGASKAEILRTIDGAESRFECFEVWLDYVEGLDPEFVTSLVERYGERMIFVFRRLSLAPTLMDASLRERIFGVLSGSSSFVDLDIRAQTRELDQAARAGHRFRLIASFHDYEDTPDDRTLRELADLARARGAEIVKLATYCRSEHDALRLLALLLELKNTGAVPIVLGMGPHGLATRILGPLWGNAVAFAPLDEERASAPGQLSRDRLGAVLDILQESIRAR